MASDRPGPDPKALWRDQEQETDPMTLDQIRTMIRRSDRRLRRVFLLFSTLLMIEAFIAGRRWTSIQDSLDRVLTVVTLLGLVGALLVVWKLVYPARNPTEPAGVYLQRRLQRRLTHLKGGWMIAILPLIPAIGLSEYLAVVRTQGPLWAHALPILLLVAAAAAILVRTHLSARGVQTQLDELNALMR